MSPKTTRLGRIIATFRGYLAVIFVIVSLLACDLVQRTVIAALARLFPRWRHRVLTAWIQAMRAIVLDIAIGVVAGGELSPTPRVPAHGGVLMVMNHQSLLDIPLIIKSVEASYPRIVTRSRYSRGIPVISHMTRLYQYPVVDPQATGRRDLLGLVEAASNGDTPVAIFPEGTRTKTGELTPWRKAGLRLLLNAKSWDVYVLAVDGVWKTRTFKDFVRNAADIHCKIACAGPFPSPAEKEDVEGFIDELKEHMEQTLAGIRGDGVP